MLRLPSWLCFLFSPRLEVDDHSSGPNLLKAFNKQTVLERNCLMICHSDFSYSPIQHVVLFQTGLFGKQSYTWQWRCYEIISYSLICVYSALSVKRLWTADWSCMVVFFCVCLTRNQSLKRDSFPPYLICSMPLGFDIKNAKKEMPLEGGTSPNLYFFPLGSLPTFSEKNT